MTASGVQHQIGRVRRIIERPRLIKLLDETDARTILLLAPAGYGKTTLARQWLKGFSRVVTVTLTPSHRDLAWFAEEFALAIEPHEAEGARRIREHVSAHAPSAQDSTELGRVIAGVIRRLDTDRIFVDNYEDVSVSPEVEATLGEIESLSDARLIVASRVRPRWISYRRTVYGEVREITQAELAMTLEEIADVVGKRQVAAQLAKQTNGWPAIVGLAASLDSKTLPAAEMPQALFRYLADEVFSRVEGDLRENLFALALLGGAASRAIKSRSEDEWLRFIEAADAVGFGLSEGTQLHPLLREFLLEKILEEPDSPQRLREAVGQSLSQGEWENALELVSRFQLEDLADPALRIAFKPLARTGRLQSLKNLASQAQARHGDPKPTVDAVLAEVEFRDGRFELASELAQRALAHMDERHPLASRAAAIVGQISLFEWDFEPAEKAFLAARRAAQDESDESEALHGLGRTTILGESPRAAGIVDELMARRHRSPSDLLRAHNARMSYLQLGGGGLGQGLHLDAIKEALPQVTDPRVRSPTIYLAAYGLSGMARYDEASHWIELWLDEAREFRLDFAMPYGLWVVARVALGQRRYAEAERALQSIEDIATRSGGLDHLVNARSLRARLLLQNADIDEARRCVELPFRTTRSPSWDAESIATRALVLSIAGESREATLAIDEAVSRTRAHEVVLLSKTATAIASERVEDSRHLIELATAWNTWDPVVCGVRASAYLAQVLASDPATRQSMEMLYSRTRDVSLARRAGFRTRSTRSPSDLLSPREIEVLGLIARGYTNRQISRALYISDSTTKVHIRHIFEKLGVRTRAEAVSRYEMFRGPELGDG